VAEMKNILIVDDDVGILESFSEILRLKGYSVDTANNASDGLKLAKEKYFHLALLDIKLPDMDGTELLAELQRVRPAMMKIMVTGYANLENSVKALNSGADAYIIKPVNPGVLIQVIQEKIREQEEAERVDGEKVSDYLERQLLNLDEDQS